jgi:hypothetical protein
VHRRGEGRRAEFKHFKAFADPARCAAIPDPQAPETFLRSQLAWDEASREPHAGVRTLYRALLTLRRSDSVLQVATRRGLSARATGELLIVTRSAGAARRTLLVNFGSTPAALGEFGLALGAPQTLLRSDPAWGGGCAPDVLPPATALILADRTDGGGHECGHVHRRLGDPSSVRRGQWSGASEVRGSINPPELRALKVVRLFAHESFHDPAAPERRWSRGRTKARSFAPSILGNCRRQPTVKGHFLRGFMLTHHGT